MAFPRAWTAILREEQAKVAKGAPFHEWAAATKRASARYHGRGEHRSNPVGIGWEKLVLYGLGAAVVVYFVKGYQAKLAAGQTTSQQFFDVPTGL
jgi:hypothetical protein